MTRAISLVGKVLLVQYWPRNFVVWSVHVMWTVLLV